MFKKKHCIYEKNSIIFRAVELFIHATSTKILYKTKCSAFTRNRKLPFELIILYLLNMPKRTLCLELQDFFSYIRKGYNTLTKKISTSAFTQRRKNLSPDVFNGMNQVLVDEFYTDNEERVNLWEGYRLLAVDGSIISLPFSKDLKEQYGVVKNYSQIDDYIFGRVSVLYDVRNNLALDGILCSTSIGEIAIANNHVKLLKEKDLVILDRGYPSFDLAYKIQEQSADFLYRCKYSFNNVTKQFMAQNSDDSIVEIKAGKGTKFSTKPYTQSTTITVRLIKVRLDNGEIELLMTSLLDSKKYPCKCFKSLYYERWGVETYYDRLKNILALENFSGLTQHAILQDFQCAIFISNVQTLIIDEAQEGIKGKYDKRKYEYKINSSISLGLMKYRIIDLFFNKGSETTLKELEELLIDHVIPIRKGRSFKRDVDKYINRKKPPMFKNRKKVL